MYGRVEPFQVIAGEGIEEARFGEPREIHRERLGGCVPFERFPGTILDSYFDMTLILSYEDAGGLSSIEISDSVDVIWDGVRLVGRPIGEVLDDLADLGFQPDEFELESLLFSSIGIGLYSPFINDRGEDVKWVAILPTAKVDKP